MAKIKHFGENTAFVAAFTAAMAASVVMAQLAATAVIALGEIVMY